MKTTDFIDIEVALFPNDTYKKNAILRGVDEYGYTFEITKCEKGSGYIEGETLFFNHSTKIIFSKKLNKIW